jgi:hypothetical protein
VTNLPESDAMVAVNDSERIDSYARDEAAKLTSRISNAARERHVSPAGKIPAAGNMLTDITADYFGAAAVVDSPDWRVKVPLAHVAYWTKEKERDL